MNYSAKRSHSSNCCCHGSYSITLIRLALAIVFIAHGVQKFSNIDQTVNFFAGLGMAPFMAYAIATAEVLGGLAMLVGVWTRKAGVVLALIMLGAISLVKGNLGFFGGFELDLILLLAALAVAVAPGPGPCSLNIPGMASRDCCTDASSCAAGACAGPECCNQKGNCCNGKNCGTGMR